MKMKLMMTIVPKLITAMDEKIKLVLNNWHIKIGIIVKINMQI